MKSLAVMFAFAAFAASGIAQAQTCASPLAFPVDANGDYLPIYGTTCSGSNLYPVICGMVDSVENDDVVRFTVDAPNTGTTITITGTTPGWDPMLFVPHGSCTNLNLCDADADIGTASNPVETLTFSGAGPHNLVVTTSPFMAPSCGGYVIMRSDF